MSTPHALRSPRVLLAVEALEQRELPDAGWLGSLTSHFQVDPNAAASDRVLVKFRASLESLAGPAAPADFTGLAIGYGMRLGSALNMVEGLYSVQLTGVTVHQALAAFAGNPLVTYVQPDFEIRVERLPNDPNFGSQYALRNTGQWMGVPGADINAETAWDYTTGSGNIVVAVLDTGINYNHPDLAANMWINPGEAQGSAYASSVYGWNFVNNTANPMDDHGHGTHVAGIIGAVGDNGIGVSGVAWNVQLMALKVLNYAGSGFTSSAIQAINFAATRGAHIANASWGGAPYDPALANAINQARAHGMIFVAAAGNQSRNIDVNPFYPASYDFDNMVRVAATDNRDLFASFSNWGPNTVQLAAPGWNILSTSRFGGYVTSSGTSMSAPMVAGALALVWDHNPTWNYQQVIAQVLGTVDPLPSLATRVSTGGRLNVGRALAESPGGGPGGGGSNGGLPGNPPGGGTGGPVQSGSWITGVTSLTSGNSINGFRVTFNSAIQASTFTLADVTQATGPNGNLNLLGVAPVAGSSTQFDITFSPQSAAGTYRCTIGPNVLNLAGVAMDQNQNGVAGEVPGDQFVAQVDFAGGGGGSSGGTTFNAAGLPINILDMKSVSSTMSIGANLTISDLRVRLNVSHTWVGDLVVTLRGPNGQTVTLANRRGGSGQGYQDTVFYDFAPVSIAQGVAPFAGEYRPETPLSVFTGIRTLGFWTLTVSDQSPGNVGKINSWALIVNAGNGASSASSVGTPNGTVFAADPLLMPTPRVIELVPTRSQQSTGHFGFESGWTQPTRQVPSMAQMSASARMSQTASERLAHAALAKLPAARVDLTPMLPRFSWAARLTNLLENS